MSDPTLQQPLTFAYRPGEPSRYVLIWLVLRRSLVVPTRIADAAALPAFIAVVRADRPGARHAVLRRLTRLSNAADAC
jgi:hypothetical protein